MYDLFLLFTKEMVLIPVLLIMYLGGFKSESTRLLFILLFTMAFNSYLKSSFAIPLPESVNPNAYAFPSGHMQVAFVFWGWIMVEFRGFFLKLFCMGILFGVAGSLIQKGYHNWFDTLGAIGVGFVTLWAYFWLMCRKFKDPKYLPIIGVAIILLSFFLIIFNHKSFVTHYLILGALTGFTIGIYFSQKSKLWKLNLAYRHIALNCLLGFLGIGSIIFFFDQNYLEISKALRFFIQYFLIAIWVSFVVERITVRKL